VSAKSIGIIGGADGPTSIYISTSVNWPLIIGIGTIVALMVIGFIVWKKSHK
jgi:Na+-transporting methylmalonyl-CoA/oxaloacetate decarboxylase beta subunit